MQRRDYHFWVYIVASRSRNLYVGVTDNLVRRSIEHRSETGGVHTARYSIHRLIYYEYFRYVRSAIRRETELKRWTREAKVALIEKRNPTWEDLFPQLWREWDGEGVVGLEADSPKGNDR
jgi:putative endonuclease